MRITRNNLKYIIPDRQSHPLARVEPIQKVGNQKPNVRKDPKIGRNDKCKCGSNLKFKKCCLNQGEKNNDDKKTL
tara:strand:- start:50 stop:274 length:225 start_codon:yes stop_codon:yes gene_type:complete